MQRRVFQVVDLGFGDSGKGTIVDYLTARHEADLIVRFNGGPQAGHNVVLPDGRHHTFSQFGSGMFVRGVRTLLSRFMMIEPYAMLNEAEHLAKVGMPDSLERTFADARCRVITPVHQIVNRLRERARGDGRHGTCGMGVGECVSDSLSYPSLTLYAGEMEDRAKVRQKLFDILESKRAASQTLLAHATPQELKVFNEPSWIEVAVELYADLTKRLTIVSATRSMEMIASSACLVMEGAQGVLLDESAGFAPHTTWSVTTYQNADALLEETGADVQKCRVGVMRTYMTRHGAGPLVTEDESLNALLPEPHNGDNGWPGRFRRGILDFVMFRHAIAACGGVDSLAVTFLDRLPQLPRLVCEKYLLDGADDFPIWGAGGMESGTLSRAKPQYVPFRTDSAEACVEAIASGLDVDVGYCSFGPTRLDKKNLHGPG